MDNWIDDLPVCIKSGVGCQANQRYRQGGAKREFHGLEDRSFNLKLNSNVGVYAVFDGHEGDAVANYAAQKVPAELLLDKDLDVFSQSEMEEVIRNAFKSVERGFFRTIDDLLVKRTNLQIHIPEELTSYETYKKYPSLMHRLQELDSEIQGGTSALLAIVQRNHLYISNVGDSRALLCTKDSRGRYHAQQLSVDHNINNDDELQRLANIGLDIVAIQNSGGVANLETTRSLGDFRVKGGYKEYEMLRSGISEPVISEPYISDKIAIDDSFQFLALFTHGFYKVVEDISGPEEANRVIISNIVHEIHEQSTAEAVAQTVVSKICREHQDKFIEMNGKVCKEREDMTLLIRLFSANLRKKSTPTTPPMSISISPMVHSGNRRSPDVMPVSIPFQDNPKCSENPPNQRPKIVIPGRRLWINQSSSQPNSRVSTPVTLMRTAATPPVAFYRYLSQVSEGSKVSTPSPTTSTSMSSLNIQSPTIDTAHASPRSMSPWAETVKPVLNNPLRIHVDDEEPTDANVIIGALAIAKSDLGTVTAQQIVNDQSEKAAEDGSSQPEVEKELDELLDDDKVDPYIDFTEFILKINDAGGEAVVFAEFMHP